jgi:hypothetical protein
MAAMRHLACAGWLNPPLLAARKGNAQHVGGARAAERHDIVRILTDDAMHGPG